MSKPFILYEEAEEAQERLAQLKEEGYGDDDDDDYSIDELVDLIHWSGQFLREHE